MVVLDKQEPGGHKAVMEKPAFCSSCGAALKPGAKFCESCGKPVMVTAAAVVPVEGRPTGREASGAAAAVGRQSADGKWRWDGTRWVAVPQAAPIVPTKKRMGYGKRLLISLALTAVVMVGALVLVPKLGLFNGPHSPTRAIGPGPYYLHYNCGQKTDCITTMVNEATANGGNTGITEDYKDKATCTGVAPIYTGIVKTFWCSTSKNPADTGP